jgi:multimeric flavodoxin WrbA
MKALMINCTLKASPAKSNTGALAEVVAEALRKEGVEIAAVRAVDRSIPPGVESEMGEGDEWPGIRRQILDSEILLFATPTWLGHPSSIAQRVLERMDAMIAETDEVSGALGDIGFTVPGQAWTYWNKGPGPGEDYSETEEGHEWSHSTGRAATANLLAVARALEARPIPPPPSE